MEKKKLDYYDATTPYIDRSIIDGKDIAIWLVDLLHNGHIVGTISSNNKLEIKKYAKRWVSD